MMVRCEELYSKLVESTARKEKATEDLTEPNAIVESLYTEKNSLLTLRSLVGMLTLETMGRPLNEVGERHRRRKHKELKTNVEKAPWFTETFGLSLS